MTVRRLVIDCATPALSIALFEDSACVAARHTELGRGHAEALMPAIAALPGGGRADRILVDIGPGSFTGVRVGIAAARALGFAWQAKVSGFGCLDLVAAMVRRDHAPREAFPVAMVGGHGELFWAIFPAEAPDEDSAPTPIASTPIAQLAAQIGHPVVYGSGAQMLVAARATGEAVSVLPDVRFIDALPEGMRTLPPKPNYGRGADAKPMQQAHPAGAVET